MERWMRQVCGAEDRGPKGRVALTLVWLMLSGMGTAMAQGYEAVADVHIRGDGEEQSVHCNHNAVYITGNGGRFTIEGECTTVFVEGSRNWVEVQYAQWIRTPGAMNSVLYLNPGTRVVDGGKGNSVAPKWQQ